MFLSYRQALEAGLEKAEHKWSILMFVLGGVGAAVVASIHMLWPDLISSANLGYRVYIINALPVAFVLVGFGLFLGENSIQWHMNRVHKHAIDTICRRLGEWASLMPTLRPTIDQELQTLADQVVAIENSTGNHSQSLPQRQELSKLFDAAKTLGILSDSLFDPEDGYRIYYERAQEAQKRAKEREIERMRSSSSSSSTSPSSYSRH